MRQMLNRESVLCRRDVIEHEDELSELIERSRVLVLGGGGSIGRAVAKEIFKRRPQCLHVVDLSENNLVELVRELRSSNYRAPDDFRTFALDIGAVEFEALLNFEKTYDYVLNLSALKHVRSEEDPFTLMRMLRVNVFNTLHSLQNSEKRGTHKYFCVSSDKAANPSNLMGATKSIMEMYLAAHQGPIDISSARFANVLFSDGSLFWGFEKRIKKNQALAAPLNIKRYFVSHEEAGLLCLLSTFLGTRGEIFYPKLSEDFLQDISELATQFLKLEGFDPIVCESEAMAKDAIRDKGANEWPLLLTESDTTGEKPFEEFYIEGEPNDETRFQDLGVIAGNRDIDVQALETFSNRIKSMESRASWSKAEIVRAISDLLPSMNYQDLGKFLDQKM